nr:MAG TPA: hypothetical protein [Bacteriophage sp.]
MALRTDFKDSIPKNTTENKKYKMTNNNDNTVSFTDVTEYSQEGSPYGAKEVNEEREAINSIIVPKTRTAEGSYLTCDVVEAGAVTWFRISSNTASKLTNGTEYKPFTVTPAPMFGVFRRIYITDSLGFIFKITTSGKVSITPFGGDIPVGTGINVSEFFMKSQE